MDMQTKLKLTMWYLKYRKYIWPTFAVVVTLVVVYFVWLR
jgi:hypothetical protein